MTDNEAKNQWNKAAYITQSLLPILDSLEETTSPQRAFKYHLKRAILEGEKFMEKHFNIHEKHGELTQPDGTIIHTRDVYNNTAKAYDFVLSKKPHEMCSIAELLKSYEAGGIDYTDFDIEYQKIV